MEKELEQFYKVFEIEPTIPITDTIILGLINIILKTRGEFRIIGSFSDIAILRKNIIQACNSIAPEIKPQVQELFKELK